MMIAALLMVAAQAAPAKAPPSVDGVQTTDKGGVGSIPAASREILDAIGDCSRAVHQRGKVDWDLLKTAGWKFGGRKTTPAKPPMPELQMVYLGKGNVINVVQLTGFAASCRTIAMVTDMVEVEREVRAGITGRFKAVSAKAYAGDTEFKAAMSRLSDKSLDKMMISDTNRYVFETNSKGGKSSVSILMTPKATDK